MVDFRYHLVSIIAVFLALAVGIVVGTAALNGPIQDGLRRSIQEQAQDKRALESDVRDLQGQVAASDEFATSLGPQLVDGALAEERVLLVTTPQTPGDLSERLRPLLADAGADVTGTLEVRPALGDPDQRQLLEDLVARVVPAGVDLPDGDPVERAAVELAAALTTGPGNEPVDTGEAQAVVAAFEEAELVSFRPEPGAEDGLTSATLVLVLAPAGSAAPATTGEQQRRDALLSLAAAFDDRSRGAAIAGPASSAAEGGLVAAARASSTVTSDVSTVDNADRGIGRIAVVRALAEQAAKGVGQYGAAPGASAPLPEAAAS
jgi:hypothetical protein